MTTTETTIETVPLLNTAALPGLEEIRAEADAIAAEMSALSEPVWALIRRAKVVLDRSNELGHLGQRLLAEQVVDDDLDADAVDAIAVLVDQLSGSDTVRRLFQTLSNITHPETILDPPLAADESERWPDLETDD